jgi:hypothetical protein
MSRKRRGGLPKTRLPLPRSGPQLHPDRLKHSRKYGARRMDPSILEEWEELQDDSSGKDRSGENAR